MIHSLAGGKMRDLDFCDFAKVKIIDTNEIRWYIFNILDLNLGDKVLVPFGIKNELVTAEVIKIERNLSEQVAPIPIKRAKEIYKKL